MKIAITQRQLTVRGITYDCLEQGWFRFLQGHELIPIPNIPNIDVDVDMIVFTGGDTSDDREQVERMLFEYAMTNNLPMLGVCHGAFFLNRMHDGNNQSILGHQNTDHPVKIGKDFYIVNSYHSGCIFELGDNLDAFAWADDFVEGFKHHTLPIWGLVWHPERMERPIIPQDLKDLLYG